MDVQDPDDRLPHTAKGLATREHIVRSAAEILIAEGASGFHLHKVRQAGFVSGSQLTHYFADRQSLLRAVVERQMDLVVQFHRQPALGGLQTLRDFERWAAANVRWLHERGYRGTPTYHFLNGQLAKSDDITRKVLAAGYSRWADLLEDALSRMVVRGVLRPKVSPRELALLLMAVHQGGGVVAFAHRQEWPLADACRFVVDYLRSAAVQPAERSARRLPRARRRPLRRTAVRDPLPFTPKGMATRRRIIAGAAELMFEHGLHQTSLEDVRNAVDVSGSQLSHYFSGKRELTRDVVALRAHQVLEVVGERPFHGIDCMASLESWADAYLRRIEPLYARGGCIYGSLVGELLDRDGEILDDLAAGYDAWLHSLYTGLLSMHRRGQLQARADPRHLATALLVAHQGGAMLTYTLSSAEPFRIALTAAVDYVSSFRSSSR